MVASKVRQQIEPGVAQWHVAVAILRDGRELSSVSILGARHDDRLAWTRLLLLSHNRVGVRKRSIAYKTRVLVSILHRINSACAIAKEESLRRIKRRSARVYFRRYKLVDRHRFVAISSQSCRRRLVAQWLKKSELEILLRRDSVIFAPAIEPKVGD